MMRYINSWKLSKRQANFLYWLLRKINPDKIEVGDWVKCFGIGYPQWKGKSFECTAVFPDGNIGISREIRVMVKDFRKVKPNERV